jgi:hypothetical protein
MTEFLSMLSMIAIMVLGSIVILSIAIAALIFVCYHVKSPGRKVKSSKTLTFILSRIYTKEELELAKKYAAVFGLENEAISVDVDALLEMGRKVEEYLGSEKVDEIVSESRTKQQEYRYDKRKKQDRIYIRHIINVIIDMHELEVAVWFSGLIRNINKSHGGDKYNGTTSSYSAA